MRTEEVVMNFKEKDCQGEKTLWIDFSTAIQFYISWIEILLPPACPSIV